MTDNKFDPPYHYFICPGCNKEIEIQPKDFPVHLKDVHNITEAKGQCTLMMHINKEPRHCASYEWKISGKTFYEYYG